MGPLCYMLQSDWDGTSMDAAARELAKWSCLPEALVRDLMSAGVGWRWTGSPARRGNRPCLCVGVEATWCRTAHQPSLDTWPVLAGRTAQLLTLDEFCTAIQDAADGCWDVESLHVLDYATIAATLGQQGGGTFPLDRSYPGNWMLSAVGWDSASSSWRATACPERGSECRLSAEDLVDQFRFYVDPSRSALLGALYRNALATHLAGIPGSRNSDPVR